MTTSIEYKNYPVSRFSSVCVEITTTNGIKSRKFMAVNEVSGLFYGADENNGWTGTDYKSYEAAKIAASHAVNHYGKIERAFN